MNRYTATLFIAAGLVFAARVHSQSGTFAPAGSSMQKLLEVRAANQDLLKKQEAALVQLDELLKAAAQTKIFAKRG